MYICTHSIDTYTDMHVYMCKHTILLVITIAMEMIVTTILGRHSEIRFLRSQTRDGLTTGLPACFGSYGKNSTTFPTCRCIKKVP